MRQAVVKLDKTLKEYKFLCENHIDSPQELVSFITEKREQIGALENDVIYKKKERCYAQLKIQNS